MIENKPNLVNSLIPVMLEAGEAIMDVYAGDIAVETKGDSSPVTVADKRGEAIIARHLARLTPDIQMVGEESTSDHGAPVELNERFWLVDPLDGTKEFIKKGTDFTVNIGLIAKGKPVLGLVYAPARKTLYTGIVGQGAEIMSIDGDYIFNRQRISTRTIPKEGRVIVASKSHRSPELEAWLNHYPDAEHVSVGSSLKFCLLAEGKADLYPRLGPTCEWDTAAAHAVLLAAGGDVLVDDATELSYGKDPTTFLNGWFLCRGDRQASTPALRP